MGVRSGNIGTDILFRTDDFIFSYRVAGILIHDGKVLLQRPRFNDGYSIPGGHISFGETTAETLIREYKEEIGLDIAIERLILVGENFWSWDGKPCHQICLYYLISMPGHSQIPLDGIFQARDDMEGELVDLDFCWIPLKELDEIILYPKSIKQYIAAIPEHPEHFVIRQE